MDGEARGDRADIRPHAVTVSALPDGVGWPDGEGSWLLAVLKRLLPEIKITAAAAELTTLMDELMVAAATLFVSLVCCLSLQVASSV